MHELFRDEHPWLGVIPGPLGFGAFEDALWIAGGGRGESAVFRYARDERAGAVGWQRCQVDAHGLRAILPIARDRAIVVGERGYYARVDVDGEVLDVATGTTACLFSLARDGLDTILAGGDGGVLLAITNGTCTVRPTGLRDRPGSPMSRGPRPCSRRFGSTPATSASRRRGICSRRRRTSAMGS
jgi:hypothetical protein